MLNAVSTVHGPAQASELQTDVMTMRIEVMLEEVTALIFRGNSDAADKVSLSATQADSRFSRRPSVSLVSKKSSLRLLRIFASSAPSSHTYSVEMEQPYDFTEHAPLC